MMKKLLLIFLLILLLAACAPAQSTIVPPLTATMTPIPTRASTATDSPKTKTPTKTPYHALTPISPLFQDLPPGSYLIYFHINSLGKGNTFAISIADDAIYQLTNDQFVTTSTNGRYLIVEQHNKKLAIYDATDKTKKSIFPRYHKSSPESYSLSPDGAYLADVSDDGVIVINLEDLSETKVTSLTNVNDIIHYTVWSPDGEWIAYLQRNAVCGFRGQQYCTDDGIYIVSTQCLKGNSAVCNSKPYGPFFNTETITIGSRLSWSPDSHQLAYATISDSQIMIHDIESNHEWALPLQNGTVQTFSWSPIEDWIAYINFDGIFLISPETQDTVQISDSPGWISGWLVVPEPTPIP